MALLIGDCDKEYEKDKKLKREDVKNLKVWLDTQPHLPKMTEMQIILFLHSNMYSNEAAKRCIDIFYTVRTHCPEFFAKRNPADLNLDVILYAKLPMPTSEGYSILYAKLIDVNPDKYQFPVQIKAFDMATMFMLNSDGTSPGVVVVNDLKGVTFMHLTKLNPLSLKKFFFYLQDCMPVRIKGLHMVNAGSLMEKLMAIIKPFIKKELFEVLHLHPELDTIFEYVPQACLPKDLGGTAPCNADLHALNKQNMIKNAAFYLEEEKQLADESKRPGKPKNAGEIFGVEGTFKKLDID